MVEFGAKLSLKDSMYATLAKNVAQMKSFQEQVESTRETLDKLTNSKYDVGVNNADAKAKCKEIEDSVKRLHQSDIEAQIKANDDEAIKKVTEVRDKLTEIKDKVFAPVVSVKDQISQKVDSTKRNLELLRNKVIAPVLTVKDKATVQIEKIKSTVRAVHTQIAKPLVMSVKDQVTSRVNVVTSKIKALANTVAKPVIAAKDAASSVISPIQEKLRALKERHEARIQAKDEASDPMSKIMGMMKKLAAGVVITIGVQKAGELLKSALFSGADLEQSIGGVETLFKNSADIVKQNADRAFATAGVSANSYMEQVTSFSASLLHSLGGDTKKAAAVADQAIIDMADNSNKFGTDITAIQNAYQGFAKQNYTMLDNLKLGYGGTKTEMERLLKDAEQLSGQKYDIENLADVYEAIHTIQENLDVTGTTAKEAATTFTGSFNQMKAAAQNFLGNIAIGGDIKGTLTDLISSTITFVAGNAIPMIVNIFSALPGAIKDGIAQSKAQLADAGKNIIDNLKSGMSLADAFKNFKTPTVGVDTSGMGKSMGSLSSVMGMIKSLTGLGSTIVSSFSQIASAVKGTFDSVAPGVMNAVQAIATGLTPVVETLTDIFVKAQPIIATVINTITSIIATLAPPISEAFNKVGAVVGDIVGVISNHMGLFQSIATTVAPIIGAAISVLGDIFSTVGGVISGVLNAVLNVVETVWGAISSIFGSSSENISSSGDSITSSVTSLSDTFSGVFSGILDIVTTIWNGITGVFQTGSEIIGTVVGGIGSAIGGIVDFFKGGSDEIGNSAPVAQAGTQAYQSAFDQMSNYAPQVQGAWDTIDAAYSSGSAAISSATSSALGSVNSLRSAMSNLGSVATSAWEGIKSSFTSGSAALNASMNSVKTGMSTLQTHFNSTLNNIRSTVSSGWAAVIANFSSAHSSLQGQIGSIRSALNNLSSAFHSMSGSVRSACSSITSAANSMASACASAANRAAAAVRNAKASSSSVPGRAMGVDRVPYNDYLIRAHEGEKLLTRNQADQYERLTSTRGMGTPPSRAMGTGVIPEDNTLINAHEGEKLLTANEARQEKQGKPIQVNVSFGDVHETADVDEMMDIVVKKLEKAIDNLA